MTVMDSVARHGKIWFQESDQRTAVNGSPDGGWLPNTGTVEDLQQIHRREVGDIMMHGCGMWAMDLMDTGWLMDPKIWENLAELQGIYRDFIAKKTAHSDFDVVLVVDEAAESVVGQPSFNGISGSLLSASRFALYRAGVSFAFAGSSYFTKYNRSFMVSTRSPFERTMCLLKVTSTEKQSSVI